MRTKQLFAPAFVLGVSLAIPVSAGAQLVDFVSTCTTINCNSLTFTGNFRHDDANRPIPFRTEIFVNGPGSCVRLEVTSPTTFGANDMEAVLVSPTGQIWRNDDSGVGSAPLIVATGSVAGWYNLIVSHFAGSGAATNFVMRYGQYDLPNTNCSNPTPPTAPQSLSTKPEF